MQRTHRLVILASLTACAGASGETKDDSAADGTSEEERPDDTADSAGGGTGTITLVNSSPSPIFEFITCDAEGVCSSQHGLSGTEVVALVEPGSSFSKTVEAGEWSAGAVSEDLRCDWNGSLVVTDGAEAAWEVTALNGTWRSSSYSCAFE